MRKFHSQLWMAALVLATAVPVTVMVGCGNTSIAAAPAATSAKTLVSVSVSPATASLAPGVTQQLTATAAYSDRSSANVSSQVAWVSSNPSLASVSSSGLATGLAAGTATMTATLPGASAIAQLTVLPPAVTLASIALSPVNPSIVIGATQQLTATAIYSDSSTANVSSQVSWSSANAGVASVNPSGFVYAVTAGSASVTATLNGVSASTQITVPQPARTLVSIALTPINSSVAVGASQQFSATANYSDQTTANVSSQVGWTSSDPVLATVNTSGLATGVAADSLTIMGTLNGVSGSTVLQVTPGSGPGSGSGSEFLFVANTNFRGDQPISYSQTVSEFRIDASSGSVTPLAQLPFPGVSPAFVVASPSGNFIYVGSIGTRSDYTDDCQVVGYAVGPNGVVNPTPVAQYFPGLPIRALGIHPSGKFLFISTPDQGLSILSIQPNGSLQPVSVPPSFLTGTGTSFTDLAVSPKGDYVYLGSDNSPAGIFAYTFDAATGTATPVPGSPYSTPRGVKSLVSGETSLFVNGGAVNYTVKPADGSLIAAPSSPYSSGAPVLDPTQHFLIGNYITADGTQGIAALPVNLATGAVGPPANFLVGADGNPTFDPLNKFLVTDFSIFHGGDSTVDSNYTCGIDVYQFDANTAAFTPVPGLPFITTCLGQAGLVVVKGH